MKQPFFLVTETGGLCLIFSLVMIKRREIYILLTQFHQLSSHSCRIMFGSMATIKSAFSGYKNLIEELILDVPTL